MHTLLKGLSVLNDKAGNVSKVSFEASDHRVDNIDFMVMVGTGMTFTAPEASSAEKNATFEKLIENAWAGKSHEIWLGRYQWTSRVEGRTVVFEAERKK